MRETIAYSGRQYARDGGFPLVGAVMRIFRKRVSSGVAQEAEKQAEDARKARQGKVIGKPAGADAWIRKKEVQVVKNEVQVVKNEVQVVVKEMKT